MAESLAPTELRTTAGDVPLHEYRLHLGGRDWSILHTGLVLTFDQEYELLNGTGAALPFGIALWPASIALAHEIVSRADDFRERHVLELGAGTGLPGLVAASFGAHVLQTDRQPAALHLCRLNGERNGVSGAEQRLADWTDWRDDTRYDWIIGSDILYAPPMHERLRAIFESGLTAGGRVLLADPFRAVSMPLLESLEASGWRIAFGRWRVSDMRGERSVAVYALSAGVRIDDGER